MFLANDNSMKFSYKYDSVYGLKPGLDCSKVYNPLCIPQSGKWSASPSSFLYNELKYNTKYKNYVPAFVWANRSWAGAPGRLSVTISGQTPTASNHNRIVTAKNSNYMVLAPSSLTRSSYLIYNESGSDRQGNNRNAIDYVSLASTYGDKSGVAFSADQIGISNNVNYFDEYTGDYSYDFCVVKSFQYVIYSENINIFPLNTPNQQIRYRFLPRIKQPVHITDDYYVSNLENLTLNEILTDYPTPVNEDCYASGLYVDSWAAISSPSNLNVKWDAIRLNNTSGILILSGYHRLSVGDNCPYDAVMHHRPFLVLPLTTDMYLTSTYEGTISMNYLEVVEAFPYFWRLYYDATL